MDTHQSCYIELYCRACKHKHTIDTHTEILCLESDYSLCLDKSLHCKNCSDKHQYSYTYNIVPHEDIVVIENAEEEAFTQHRRNIILRMGTPTPYQDPYSQDAQRMHFDSDNDDTVTFASDDSMPVYDPHFKPDERFKVLEGYFNLGPMHFQEPQYKGLQLLQRNEPTYQHEYLLYDSGTDTTDKVNVLVLDDLVLDEESGEFESDESGFVHYPYWDSVVKDSSIQVNLEPLTLTNYHLRYPNEHTLSTERRAIENICRGSPRDVDEFVFRDPLNKPWFRPRSKGTQTDPDMQQSFTNSELWGSEEPETDNISE